MIADIQDRIRGKTGVRDNLSNGGVVQVDPGLPFLLVYREPADGKDAGTGQLISGEAAFLHMRDGEEDEAIPFIRWLSETGSARHGAFLILEVWAGPAESSAFTIHAPPHGPAPEAVVKLVEALQPLTELHAGLEVVVDDDDERGPTEHRPLFSVEESWQREVLLLGLEVPPVYRAPDTGRVYPIFLRRFQGLLSMAVRQAVYEFVRVQTSADVENHLSLGTHRLDDASRRIDRELVSLEKEFDILLLTSPVNLDEAWSRFQDNHFEVNPEFHYRLLPFDPDLVKRRLYGIRMEEIHDPAISDLFHEKRSELDTLLTMLGERGDPGFRQSSHRMYGLVDDTLLDLAHLILTEVKPPSRWRGDWVDALGFQAAARSELKHYAERHPALDRRIQIRRDISGLMVSEGNLLIGEKLRIRSDRLAPLIHHEVGTHVLTFVNGHAQPLEQLSLGLCDYDELQEGLAVLAEYLVGGLDSLRMRLLAARVVAAHSVQEGADFVETFRMLTQEHGYSDSGAWHVATRVHASGGFTRDLIYLRGLVGLVGHLAEGGELEPLYVGKIALKHIPIMDELRHRGVLKEPPLLPRFLDDPESRRRLDAVRRGITLTEMICQPTG